MDRVTFVYVLSVGRIHEILELVTIQLKLFKFPNVRGMQIRNIGIG